MALPISQKVLQSLQANELNMAMDYSIFLRLPPKQ
jgi:hypothetical protein